MKIKQKNLIFQKAGFTLTELVVVMVLLSLVTLLATSITLMVNRSQQISLIDSNGESEIIMLESAFKDWLSLFDHKDCQIEISENKIKVSCAQEKYMEFGSDTLSYKSADDTTEINFSAITKITFDIYDGNIVCCTATFANTDYNHKILYYLRAAETQQASKV